MNDVVQALQTSNAYPHSVGAVQLIETHLSWIFLTGDFAYKLKKPLQLAFVDFSTLDRRAHYCREEVGLNQQYTDGVYVGALPVVRNRDGSIKVAAMPVTEEATIVDWVVQMHQFDQSCQGDHLVAASAVGTKEFFNFGSRLAQQHAHIESTSTPASVSDAIQENFSTLKSIACIPDCQPQIDWLQRSSQRQLLDWESLLLDRKLHGFVRECHGDLHLANIMWHKDRLQAFDCLEFNRPLREIDVWNDVAFLVMDCCVRDRADLAYSFVDGYLNSSGDYQGALLLNFYCQYRSMVRAKVAAIAYAQSEESDVAAYRRLQLHLDWAQQQARCEPGLLVVCCGLSGSGKSYWSAQLVSKLAALRLRSDVFRKTSAGLTVQGSSHSGIGSDLYAPERSDMVYSGLARLCSRALQQGENVIVDATCLTKAQRDLFTLAAQEHGSPSVILHLTAEDSVLRERIVQRQQQGNDVSEADLAVLAWQLQHQETPRSPESVVVADSSSTDIDQLVSRINAKAQSATGII